MLYNYGKEKLRNSENAVILGNKKLLEGLRVGNMGFLNSFSPRVSLNFHL